MTYLFSDLEYAATLTTGFMMEKPKSLNDFTDYELRYELSIDEIRRVAQGEREYLLKNAPENKSDLATLKTIISETEQGINPFVSTSVAHTRSELSSVRSARIITGFLEICNILLCIVLMSGTAYGAFIVLNGPNQSYALPIFVAGSLIATIVYFVFKSYYIFLELLSDIADDTRRIRRLQG